MVSRPPRSTNEALLLIHSQHDWEMEEGVLLRNITTFTIIHMTMNNGRITTITIRQMNGYIGLSSLLSSFCPLWPRAADAARLHHDKG